MSYYFYLWHWLTLCPVVKKFLDEAPQKFIPVLTPSEFTIIETPAATASLKQRDVFGDLDIGWEFFFNSRIFTNFEMPQNCKKNSSLWCVNMKLKKFLDLENYKQNLSQKRASSLYCPAECCCLNCSAVTNFYSKLSSFLLAPVAVKLVKYTYCSLRSQEISINLTQLNSWVCYSVEFKMQTVPRAVEPHSGVRSQCSFSEHGTHDPHV